jgi:hypothetical protein
MTDRTNKGVQADHIVAGSMAVGDHATARGGSVHQEFTTGDAGVVPGGAEVVAALRARGLDGLAGAYAALDRALAAPVDQAAVQAVNREEVVGLARDLGDTLRAGEPDRPRARSLLLRILTVAAGVSAIVSAATDLLKHLEGLG